jgi:hypothetical protein
MTDTTAPRTAAGRKALAGYGLLYVIIGPDRFEVGRDEFIARQAERILAIEAEAIEPLLALVRAAQNLPTHAARAGHADCICVYHEDFRTALAALPESVRVAARKPE